MRITGYIVLILVLVGCATDYEDAADYGREEYSRMKDAISSGLEAEDLEYLAEAKTRDLMDLTDLIQDPEYPQELKADASNQLRTLFSPDAVVMIHGDSTSGLDSVLSWVEKGEMNLQVMESGLSSRSNLDSLETGVFSGSMRVNGQVSDFSLEYVIQDEQKVLGHDTLHTRRMRFTRLEIFGE